MLEKEFMNVYLQTGSRPIGNPQDAWDWIMERITYFKEKEIEKSKLYLLVENVLLYLTDCYISNFNEFISVVNDVSPIIITCEKLLDYGEEKKAKRICEPYIRYIQSAKRNLAGKQICCQNRMERFFVDEEFSALKNLQEMKDNYTYLLVLYCRILDGILLETKGDMDECQREKRSLLLFAKEMSPCNAAVWENLSRVSESEEEYHDCMKKALRYSVYDSKPYGLGMLYKNLALHFSIRNVKLARALVCICKMYLINPLEVDFIFSKSGIRPMKNEDKAKGILQAAGIQVGYSDIAKKALAIELKQNLDSFKFFMTLHEVRKKIERSILPQMLYEDTKQFMDIIKDYGAAFLAYIYDDCFSVEKYESPYRSYDFLVFEIKTHNRKIKIWRVQMPEPMAMPDCKEVYFAIYYTNK